MTRVDKIKLALTRNWNLPGKSRLARWLIPSVLKSSPYFTGISWLEGENVAIYIDTRSYIEWIVFSQGNYEKEIGSLLKLSLMPGYVALDVGANIGVQSLRMAKLVGPNGSVISCEPLPHLRERLAANLALNQVENVSIIPAALSEYCGATEISFDLDNWNQGTASLSKVHKSSVSVEVFTGDELLERRNVKRLDLVKIDVEGHEFQVIKGLQKSINKYHPRIIFEYDENYWQRSGSRYADCFTLLLELEYDIYGVYEQGAQKLTAQDGDIASNIYCIPSTNRQTRQ